MRLIDADAIYQWYTHTFDFNHNEIRFSINDIRDNLYNIPTVDAVPRELYESMESTCYKLQQALGESWIPCSERLPDKDDRYLVTNSDWGSYEVSWNVWLTNSNQWLYNGNPIAWMELPEPYINNKGEQHD